MEDIFKELQKLGFSQYECKAYVSLLKHSPMTGYEISKRSSVPRSMIYEVLGKLLDKGAVYIVPSDPVNYAPLPAKDLISRLRLNFEHSFDFLEKNLSILESEQEVDTIHRISGDENVLAEMNSLIMNAQEEIWLSVWAPQIPSIKDAVLRKEKDGLSVTSILFGAPDTSLGYTTHHDYMSPKVAEERTNGRLTIVARDNEEVIIANFFPATQGWAIKTQDPALVLVALEYIGHDIIFAALTNEIGEQRVEALWRENKELLRVVTGKRFK
ncbi:TrmB family transcriptional regulator [Niallia taxi]|uniref:TrmB family transcriptional regulator n=1 Tax=Niallia taxi TaxID=2499688 RepID=UPI0021A40413|nr:helix-turn-helix domain-containing protein [Niallia taxi]MCT2345484.1 TrmB family transcriptional regulator [Niallia taxi]